MSVLIVTPGGFDLVRGAVRALRAQTARASLELVVVAPSRETLGPFEGEAAGFSRVRVVEAGEIRRASRAKAAGVRAARAPFVAFAEEHCYPEPDWARLLIDARAARDARGAHTARARGGRGLRLRRGAGRRALLLFRDEP